MATAPLVSIKDVKSSQIPPNSAAPIPLKSGTLTLTEPLVGSNPTSAKLFLTITPSASSADTTPLTLPIHPDFFLGSKSGLCQTFRFKITDDLGAIEIEFPETISEEDALNFEKVMVYNGFLKTGLVAGADDFSKTIAETANNLKNYLSRKTDERNEQAETPEKESEFSDITKEIVDTAEVATEKVAETSTTVGKTISEAVYSAGTWIGEKTGLNNNQDEMSSEQPKSLARETFDQTLEGAAITGRELGNGIKLVGSEIGESASKIVAHDHGDEAKNLVEGTRQTGANMGNAAVNLVEGTSVTINAAKAGAGATSGESEAGKKEGTEQE
ncbi:hypothetical protein TWF730_001885 [Orbilia blumenaviensis]|uniref:Senescence domain-containing protein n=1 Tax=Orbilia blumenaviensis TaxID=1796055 RepID=A0AAV9UHB4_9PEZI